jgi:hypothetical protein
MINQAIHSDKDNKIVTKKVIYSTIIDNLILLFSLLVIISGFVIYTKSNILISEGLMGSGILIGGYAFRKLSKK